MSRTANRERWRADLQEYRAAVLESGGIGAEELRSDAALRRAYADVCERTEAVRVAFNADPAANRAAWDEAQLELRRMRRTWREVRDALGRGGPQVLEGYVEPSDDELGGYGR